MRDREITAVLKALRRIEAEQHLTLESLGRRLGFSASHLSMLFSGRRRPGVRFLRVVIERFPEIRQMLAKSLRAPTESGKPK
jgi:transcriptional regulator with XRE-family HTH domain